MTLQRHLQGHEVCTQRTAQVPSRTHIKNAGLLLQLSWLDRLLSPLILLSMIIGVIIGEFAPNVQSTFDTVKLHNVSARSYEYTRMSICTLTQNMTAIAIGLIAMMWPILTKVQYECLPAMFSSRRLWVHLSISFILNWIIGPLVMLAVVWATLPDLPTYRTGVIMVGLARCIAMVMIWNQMAGGDHDYCAILVIINSVLQIILYSPYAVLFINIIGNTAESSAIHVSYGNVAISVLIVRFSSPLFQILSTTFN